jgi:GLPGLI family protein
MQYIIRAIVLATGISGTFQQSFAQDSTEGRIHYEITYNIHASLKPDQLQYKDMIPETVVEKAELIYKGQRLKAYFPDAVDKEQDGVNTQIRIATEEGNERYADIDSQKIWWLDKAQQPPVLVEKALDAGEEDKITMQEAPGTQQILNYTCKKLVIKSKKDGATTVWYTNELPLKAGSPFSTFTEKGVVLAMESKRAAFKATAIEFTPVADKDVTPPPDIKIVKARP